MAFINSISFGGDSTELDARLGVLTTATAILVNDGKTEIGNSINNIVDATSSKSCPRAPITSGFTFPDSKSVSYVDPAFGTVVVRCADDVNNFQKILQLNPSERPTTDFTTSYGEPGGFGSADPSQNWYRGDNPAFGYSGRQEQYLTPCTGLIPSSYDGNLQADISNGIYGVHFTYEFTSPVNFTSLQMFLNSGTVSIPVFTPRWVFFFGSNDGENWAMFNEPQTYNYPFPDTSSNFVVVNNLQHTYTFTPYNETYTYYRFVVASAGTGYFYLSSAQWNSSGQLSASDVATNSLTTVNIGTSDRVLNLQTNDFRINDVPFSVEELNAFGTNASLNVLVGTSNKTLDLQTNDLRLNNVPLFPISYDDLSSKPVIPAAQENSDWNSVSGVSQILNKPTIQDVASSPSFGTTATAAVSVGRNTQTTTLTGSSITVSTTQTISPTTTHTASQTGIVQTAIIACTSETGSAVTSTAPAASFRVPFQWRIIGARAHYTNDTDGTPPTAAIVVDIRHNTTPMSINTQGTSIFGAARLNIDANRYSTVNSTAVANNGALATNPVTVPDDSVVSIFITSTSTGAQGVKAVIYYTL